MPVRSSLMGSQCGSIFEVSVTPLAPSMAVGINPMLFKIFFSVEQPLAGVTPISVVALRVSTIYAFAQHVPEYLGIIQLRSKPD